VHVGLAILFPGAPRAVSPSQAYHDAAFWYNVNYRAVGPYYPTECLLPVPPYRLPPMFIKPVQPFFQYIPMGTGTRPVQSTEILPIRSQSLVGQDIGKKL